MRGRAAIFGLALAVTAVVALPALGCGGLAGGGAGDAAADAAIEAGYDAPVCEDATATAIGPNFSKVVWPRGPVVLDTTDVYWVGSFENAGAGFILRTPKAGGTTETIAALCDGNLAVDETQVYYTASDAKGTALYAQPKVGGPSSVLAGGLPAVGTIVVDEVAVYFSTNGKIASVPKGGGAPVTLSEAPSLPCLPSQTGAGSPCAPPVVFGVDDQAVYWSVRDGNAAHPVTGIRSTSKASGAVTNLISLPTSTLTSVVGANDIYFTSQDANTGIWNLASISKHGGSPTTLAPNIGGSDLATDGRAVFTDDGSYMLGLVEVPLAGGRPTTVLSWGLGFGGVAVDGTFIYWLKYAETGASLIRSCK